MFCIARAVLEEVCVGTLRGNFWIISSLSLWEEWTAEGFHSPLHGNEYFSCWKMQFWSLQNWINLVDAFHGEFCMWGNVKTIVSSLHSHHWELWWKHTSGEESFALNHFLHPDQEWMCAQAPSSQESSITTKLPQVCHLNLSGFHSAEINHLCQYDSRIIFKKLFGFTAVWEYQLSYLPYFWGHFKKEF